jgi:choice-of-anchor A domain-containing protein
LAPRRRPISGWWKTPPGQNFHDWFFGGGKQSADWIEPSQLAKAIALVGRVGAPTPTSNLEACSETTTSFRTQNVPLLFEPRQRPWALGTIGGQDYPGEFAVVALGDVAGLRSSEGSIAAGGSIALQHFVLKPGHNQRVGLVGGADVSLFFGTAVGDVRHCGPLSKDHALVLGSTIPDCSVAFRDVDKELQRLTQSLFELEPNVELSVADEGDVSFTGSSTMMNVVSIDARVLRRAGRLRLDFPRRSPVLVNVRGRNAHLDLGMEWGHSSPSDVLWNFEAADVELVPRGLGGTILALRRREGCAVRRASGEGPRQSDREQRYRSASDQVGALRALGKVALC